MQQMAREAFPVKAIDPNQMWKTTSVITVTVTTEKAERIHIYQGNPYSTADNAYLLAVKDVQAGTSDICFDAPTALQTLFVARRNAEGMSEAVAAEIKDGSVGVDFTNGTRKAQRKSLPRFTQGFQPGQAPYAICVPGKWLWPVEFSTVTLAYDKFASWAQDATQDVLWYDTPTLEHIVNLYDK